MTMLSSEELQMITALAVKQVTIEKKIALLEMELKEETEKLKEVREKDLPNAMFEVGMTAFTLKDGTKITVKDDVYCSIPKEDGGRAFAWLRGHDFGGLIKNAISVEFGKGEDDKAIEAATLLAEHGFSPEQKQSVHPSTLKAFVKEQMGKGNDIPLDVFGAFTVTKSKVDLPK